MKTRLFIKTLIASAVTFGLGFAMAAPYEIIDLGKVEGGTNSFAYGINNAGEVVGYGNGPLSEDENGNLVREFNSHALFFLDSGVLDLLALEGGIASVALSINDGGVIVGYSDEVRTETTDEGNEIEIRENFATIFNGSGITKIPGLDELTGAKAFDINNSGIVVGNAFVDLDDDDTTPNVNRGFVVNSSNGEGLVVLPSLREDPDGGQTHPLSINDNGDIVGWTQYDEDSDSAGIRGFLTNVSDPAQLEELPNIGTLVTIASDINNNGVIVGYARRRSNSTRTVAFKYDPATDNELKQLPYFDSDYDNATANAINDNEQIVGQALVSVPTAGLNTGFLYEDGQLKDLNDLIPCDSGWRIDSATNINNNGEIIGYGLREDVIDGETMFEVRAFKLEPTGDAVEVCETPDEDDSDGGGSFSWFGLSLLALFGLRRKRNQQ
ncbi:DUF3466 family protein [Kangiella sp. TOML190]|uniref:DUF3466 family protein n=1 Tax=Kangiella sp. TOML190 TaxID=2931351 RepID=UPI002041FC64|nr:DUF3466 family protein [Kangiella sp. TOML190]